MKGKFGRYMLRMTPLQYREWVRAWLAELGEIDDRQASLLWLSSGIRLLVWTHADAIRRSPTMLLRGIYMKTVLLTLSTINSLAGLFLIGLFFAFSDSPAAPLLIGIGMLAQGAYTTIYLTKQLNRFEPYARRLLLVGQTISLVIGLGGGAIAFVSNINPPNGDYEYGPMSMFGLIALQAFAAMLYSTLNDLESSAKV